MSDKKIIEKHEQNLNADPISGAHGAHPIGVATGGTAGAAAGAALGTIGGPVGMVAGMAAGAIAGGLAGKAAGEAINPTVEETYWRANFHNRPYVLQGASYDDYRLGYQYAWENYPRYVGRTFEDVELELSQGWPGHADRKLLEWDKQKHATRDAWKRLEPAAKV